MQKEFEREFETVGICQNIISASEEGEEGEGDEGAVVEVKVEEQESEMVEDKGADHGDKDAEEEEKVTEEVKGDEEENTGDNEEEVEASTRTTETNIDGDLAHLLEGKGLLSGGIISTKFTISATSDPFGL